MTELSEHRRRLIKSHTVRGALASVSAKGDTVTLKASAGLPLKKLEITGNTSYQDNASVSEPHDIVNCGDNGLTFEIRGKNLCDLEYFKKNSIVSRYEYVPVFVGTGNTVTVSLPEKYPTGLDFYLCVSYENRKGSGDAQSWGWLYSSNSNNLCRKSITFKASEDYIYINIANTVQCYKYVGYLQVELGSAATEYEPYIEPKAVSIPNISLAKIDISADKLTVNYGNKSVIKSGYSQYLNVADCELSFVATSNSSYVLIDIENMPRPHTFNAPYGVGICNVCTWQTEEITELPKKEVCVGASGGRLRLYISQDLVSDYVKTSGSGYHYITVENFRSWLAAHPIEILYSTSSKQSVDYSSEPWVEELFKANTPYGLDASLKISSDVSITELSAEYYSLTVQDEYELKISYLSTQGVEILPSEAYSVRRGALCTVIPKHIDGYIPTQGEYSALVGESTELKIYYEKGEANE